MERDVSDIFCPFVSCPSKETEVNKELFINHLGALEKQFSLHFKDADVSKFI
jgi:hypothetical protein